MNTIVYYTIILYYIITDIGIDEYQYELAYKDNSLIDRYLLITY